MFSRGSSHDIREQSPDGLRKQRFVLQISKFRLICDLFLTLVEVLTVIYCYLLF